MDTFIIPTRHLHQMEPVSVSIPTFKQLEKVIYDPVKQIPFLLGNSVGEGTLLAISEASPIRLSYNCYPHFYYFSDEFSLDRVKTLDDLFRQVIRFKYFLSNDRNTANGLIPTVDQLMELYHLFV